MRASPGVRTASRGPEPTYSVSTTLAATVLVVGAFLAALVAVARPLAAAGTLTAAGLAWPVVRHAAGRYRRRRREGRTRRVCLPATGVCIEA